MDLYVKEPTSPFLRNCHDEKLVTLKTENVPDHCGKFQRGSCACNSLHGIVVCGRSIIIKNEEHLVNAYPGYALPNDCTPDEELTIVTWLTRSRFLMFSHGYKNWHLKDCEPPHCNCECSVKTMERFLVPNHIFESQSHKNCNVCTVYTLIGEPVFCLKKVVLSAQNKGPTVESVLNVSPQ